MLPSDSSGPRHFTYLRIRRPARNLPDDNMLLHLQELGRSLAMSADSTGVKPPVELTPNISALRLGLRDTLVRGWLSGVQGLPDDAPPSAQR